MPGVVIDLADLAWWHWLLIAAGVLGLTGGWSYLMTLALRRPGRRK